MISSLILAVCLGLAVPGGFDLNTATLQQLQELDGLDSQQASDLYTYIYETGGLQSIYDVMEIPGFGAEELEYLRNNCVVVPPSEGRISPDISALWKGWPPKTARVMPQWTCGRITFFVPFLLIR